MRLHFSNTHFVNLQNWLKAGCLFFLLLLPSSLHLLILPPQLPLPLVPLDLFFFSSSPLSLLSSFPFLSGDFSFSTLNLCSRLLLKISKRKHRTGVEKEYQWVTCTCDGLLGLDLPSSFWVLDNKC